MTKKHKHSSSAELKAEGILAGKDFSSMLVERGFSEQVEGTRWLFPEEAMFLVEDGYLTVTQKGQQLEKSELRSQLEATNPGFFKRYLVYRDLRKKGYRPRAGAKYGVDFRVYEPPGEAKDKSHRHARFLVWVVDQDQPIKASTLVGINRVTHSVKKLLWLAVVDKDMDVTYVQMSRAQP